MDFLSPTFLWALPLAGLPVLIHLISRRRREIIRWGAMQFLLACATAQRRWMRLKDLLLLLLRVAALLALVAALAQPLARLGSTSGASKDVILVFDNSLSTARRDRGMSLLDREKDLAAELVGRLNGNDKVRVLSLSAAPRWPVADPLAATGSGRETILSLIDEIEAAEGGADILQGIQQALASQPDEGQALRLVILLSDGQAYGWHSGQSNAWSTIENAAKKSKTPVRVNVCLLDPGSSEPSNLAVEHLSASREVTAPGRDFNLTAVIRNFGSTTQSGALLSWLAGDQSLGVTSLPPLEAGAATTVSHIHRLLRAGVVEVMCRVEVADDLLKDNENRVLVEAVDSIPVLIVEGTAHADPLETDSAYFLAALGHSQGTANSRWRSVFRPTLVKASDFSGEGLAAFRCVVLANVGPLSSSVLERLRQYVQAGDGLWLALGDQTDPDHFNAEWFADGAGLAPLPLLQPVGDPREREEFLRIQPPSPNHPATALLADTARLDLEKARIYRRHVFGAPSIRGTSVLVQLEQGAPLVVEGSAGPGRVIVQAVPLGVSWSSLPLCQAYVAAVHEWLWYLVEPGLEKRNVERGSSWTTSFPSDEVSRTAQVSAPGEEPVLVPGHEEYGQVHFRYGSTFVPGRYTVQVSKSDGTSERREFHVQRDPLESDLTPLTDGAKEMLSTNGLHFVEDPLRFDHRAPRIEAREPLAPQFLFALAAFLGVEMLVAGQPFRRRRQMNAARTTKF